MHGHILREPHNLASGWVNFDFKKAFGCRVKVINDAAMQALGSYKGGRCFSLRDPRGQGRSQAATEYLAPLDSRADGSR